MVPKRTAEKVTLLSGESFSTWSGSPLSVEQVPRTSLGLVLFTGYVESSHSLGFGSGFVVGEKEKKRSENNKMNKDEIMRSPK